MLTTIAGTNWWNLGMGGKLPTFLCPPNCVGELDYVGLDYYWGVNTPLPSRLAHLASAIEQRYGNAPVWPEALYRILRESHEQFPDKPILVIENGCVTIADGVSREDYISRHIHQVARALADKVPVEAYICWSITSNREWGLHFDDNSDFGLYHIDLDRDADLKRKSTKAGAVYQSIIGARSV